MHTETQPAVLIHTMPAEIHTGIEKAGMYITYFIVYELRICQKSLYGITFTCHLLLNWNASY